MTHTQLFPAATFGTSVPQLDSKHRAMRLMVVDDDWQTSELVRKALLLNGFIVESITSIKSAQLELSMRAYDCIILNPGISGMTGVAAMQLLRTSGQRLPLMLISNCQDVSERIRAINSGADDFLVKPFYMEELVARVRAISRRRTDSPLSQLSVGDITLDRQTRRARRGDSEIELTSREYHLLEFLMRCSGQTCSRESIHRTIWKTDYNPCTNIVDVYVRKLRQKLTSNGGPPGSCQIHSVRSIGYVMKAAPIEGG